MIINIKLRFSDIKINKDLFEKLISLRDNFKINEINSVVEFLLSYYEEACIKKTYFY